MELEINRLLELDAEDEQTLIEVAKNLKHIRFMVWDHEHDDNEQVGNIIWKIFSQAQRTLKTLELSSVYLPCALPNLKFLEVKIKKYSVEDLANLLDTLDLDHLEEIRFWGISRAGANLIAQKYAHHCCYAYMFPELMITTALPVRAIRASSLNLIMQMKYPECIEYIFAVIWLGETSKEFNNGWDQPNLSNFPNLKEIHASFCCHYRDNNILEEKKRLLKESVSNLGIKLIEPEFIEPVDVDINFARKGPFNGCRFIFNG